MYARDKSKARNFKFPPIALVVQGADNGGGGWDALVRWVVLGGGVEKEKKKIMDY